MKIFMYFLCVFAILSCGDDDSSEITEQAVACTLTVEPSFRITVLDASDDSLLEGVTVTALEGDFSAILTAVSPGVYAGPNERTGTYILTLEKDGFQTITVTAPQIVELTDDQCHVDTIETTYELVAN